ARRRCVAEQASSSCIVSGQPFFFSSRRRHTRFSRDWSSDVCSYDLAATLHVAEDGRPHLTGDAGGELTFEYLADATQPDRVGTRSEERRVGKGWTCSARTSPSQCSNPWSSWPR